MARRVRYTNPADGKVEMVTSYQLSKLKRRDKRRAKAAEEKKKVKKIDRMAAPKPKPKPKSKSIGQTPVSPRRTFRRDPAARSQTSAPTPKPKPAAKPAPKAPDKKARVTERGGVQARLRELKKKRNRVQRARLSELKKKRDARKKANEDKKVLKHGGLVKSRRKFKS